MPTSHWMQDEKTQKKMYHIIGNIKSHAKAFAIK